MHSGREGVVEDRKYLGIIINSRLDWKPNTDAVHMGMNRLYFQRTLRSFNVCSKTLESFYQSVVVSELFFTGVCWGSSISANDTNTLNNLMRNQVQTGRLRPRCREGYQTNHNAYH